MMNKENEVWAMSTYNFQLKNLLVRKMGEVNWAAILGILKVCSSKQWESSNLTINFFNILINLKNN